MNSSLVDTIADAILYEGYNLYPYRPSVKSRHRWTFGGLYPRSYSDAQAGADSWSNQSQCLVEGSPTTRLAVKVRFLQLVQRNVGRIIQPLAEWPQGREPQYEVVDAMEVGSTSYPTWQEAVERTVEPVPCELGELASQSRRKDFSFLAQHEIQPLREPGSPVVGVIVRDQEAVSGWIEVGAEAVQAGLYRITVRVLNGTALENAAIAGREEALMRALVSTHAILSVEGGQFVSLMDPPERWRTAAAGCRNTGAWPVLVGQMPDRDAMLSAPIILYDYPQVAPESPGELFDSTEIDEILTLRILTLTDEEKRQMQSVDDRTRSLLERTESLARRQLAGLHGAVRSLRPVELGQPAAVEPADNRPALAGVRVGGVEVHPGDRVRLRPREGADILDLALQDKIATIEAIEQDMEDRVYLAVVLDEDPGKDFGHQRLPGHRFFFRPEEVLPLSGEGSPR